MKQSPLFFLAVGLITFSGLLLEIALTRVLSILFFYNYVFVILAVAVLGSGLGAAFAHHRLGASKDEMGLVLPATAVSLATLLLGLLVVALAGVDGRLPLTLFSLLPYFGVGYLLAAAFTRARESATTLYAADLTGAALGAAAAVPLLSRLPDLQAIFFAAAAFAAAALCFHAANPSRLRAAAPPAGLLLLALITLFLPFLTIDISRLALPKPAARLLQSNPQAQIIASSGDAFARVDLIASPQNPRERLLFVDGAAGSVMPRFPVTREEELAWQAELGYFPFRISPSDVFIIGPGGGKDLLFALLGGSERITAVELSAQINDLVVANASFNGGLATDPRVNLVVGEGRSYLRRQDAAYDLICLSELVTLTAERNSYMLAENYAFTVEAFDDYLAHLTPDGRIALKMYDELTLTRAFVTAITALQENGTAAETAVRHIAVLLDPAAVSAQDPLRAPLLLVYKEPLTPEQGTTLLAEIQEAGLIPVFVPHVLERPPLALVAAGETTVEQLVADFSRGDISATSDNAPFFYEFRRGLPDLLQQVGLALLIALLPLGLYFARRRKTVRRGPYWLLIAYFAALGLGFMLLEQALLQRFALFLGHPTLVLSVVLGSILFAGGVGSFVGGRLAGERPYRLLITVALVIAGLSLLYAWVLPGLLNALTAVETAARIAVVILIAGLPAFFLGMPFSLGLQISNAAAGKHIIPLAWSSNGIAAVYGSVLATMVGMVSGFTAVFLASALIYGCIALIIYQIQT